MSENNSDLTTVLIAGGLGYLFAPIIAPIMAVVLFIAVVQFTPTWIWWLYGGVFVAGALVAILLSGRGNCYEAIDETPVPHTPQELELIDACRDQLRLAMAWAAKEDLLKDRCREQGIDPEAQILEPVSEEDYEKEFSFEAFLEEEKLDVALYQRNVARIKAALDRAGIDSTDVLDLPTQDAANLYVRRYFESRRKQA